MAEFNVDNVYYISESDDPSKMHAGPKARLDFEAICSDLGFTSINVDCDAGSGGAIGKAMAHIKRARVWSKNLSTLKNSVILINFPPLNHSLLHWCWMGRISRRGCKTVLFVHDLNILRPEYDAAMSLASRIRFTFEEKSMLKRATVIVAHNERMKSEFVSRFKLPAERIVTLECFDYLATDNPAQLHTKGDAFVIAGSLSAEKSGYIYDANLPGDIRLYGLALEAPIAENVTYVGGFPPKDLPSELQGSFGLVWDGPSIQTCSGVFGEYLRFNNPHKASLYIAAAMPLLVWEESAIAELVSKEGIGLVGSSIGDLIQKARSASETAYSQMAENAKMNSVRVRTGWFTKRVLEKAFDAMGLDDCELK